MYSPRPADAAPGRRYHVAVAAYLATVAVSVVAYGQWPSTALGIALAAANALTFAYANVVWVRRERAGSGVERAISTESAALAFHALMLATATYGLFEQFTDLPHISMYVPFVFGVVAWTAAWAVMRRRLT
jgi:hypothetical protein